MAITYDVEYWQTSDPDGTRTLVTGISASPYTLPGLTSPIEYDWRVREVDTISGVKYVSTWAEGSSFTTVVGPVEVNLGTITESSSVLSVTPQNDFTAPVITLTGGSKVVVELGTTWTDPGYTATDDTDGDITGSVVVGGDTIDMNTSAVYNVTYNVSDAAGNAADEVAREVHVSAAQSATSWNLEWRPVGGGTTQVTGLVSSDYNLTGLTAAQDYEFRVQGLIGSFESAWSSWSPFTTAAGSGITVNLGIISGAESAFTLTAQIDPNTEVNLDAIAESSTANPITADASGEVVVPLGTITELGVVLSMTPEVLSNIDVNLGTITETIALFDITAGQQPVVDANEWDVEIVNDITGAVTLVSGLTQSDYVPTLLPHTPYKFRVKGFVQGRAFESAWSGYSSVFITDATPIAIAPTAAITGDIDPFQVDFDDVITGSNVYDIQAFINARCSNVDVTFDGALQDEILLNGTDSAEVRVYLNGGYRIGIETLNDELAWVDGILLEGASQESGDDGIKLE